MGPAGALGVVTYAGPVNPDEGPVGQFVGVFDLTSVNGNREEAILPKAWFALPDAQNNEEAEVYSAACLTPDASRLTVAYVGRTGEMRLLTVDLSPNGAGPVSLKSLFPVSTTIPSSALSPPHAP